ncbi:hypothetical protein B0H12DRAFT_1238496 [Mycena haematopus]|nr:hypothetical protein B0H12DRAFT_1238496 [Mycena haematopus]
MGRWTQYNEDSTRLPVGMKRIGYDADTARYTFCDREGNIYMGPAHEEYGLLSLVQETSSAASPTDDRPHAFASDTDTETSKPGLSVEVPATFHDILPSHLITSPSSAESMLDASESPLTVGSRLRDAVRRTALPAMQNAVNSVRRSATSVRKLPRTRDKEKDGLIRRRSGPAPSNHEKD